MEREREKTRTSRPAVMIGCFHQLCYYLWCRVKNETVILSRRLVTLLQQRETESLVQKSLMCYHRITGQELHITAVDGAARIAGIASNIEAGESP